MTEDKEIKDQLGEEPEARSNPDVNEYNDFDEDKVRHLLDQGDFMSWDDAINWLRDFGAHDNYFEPGQDKMMKDDFEMLRDNGVVFTKDPGIVYSTILENR